VSETAPVVVLAGGTGGAKLARGMRDVVGPGSLVVIANTGDDLEIYGGYVSPDPDLITFWLADLIDERGWGLDGDTFKTMDGLRALGREVWFNLGDRDLAIAIQRAERLAGGHRLTDAQREIGAALGLSTPVLPMSDRPVRTQILAAGRWWSLQEYLISSGQPDVDDVQFRGADAATATPEVLAAIAGASAVVIGPSNPVISIGPILAVPEIAQALQNTEAPVIAVSPIVAGEILKGPSAKFIAARGAELSGEGIAELYAGLLDGLVCDDEPEGIPTLRTDLLMDGAAGRRRLASESLTFALGLGREAAPSGSGSGLGTGTE
jgi:LPPG:FO 2-phospho-L-lactate transferase